MTREEAINTLTVEQRRWAEMIGQYPDGTPVEPALYDSKQWTKKTKSHKRKK